MRRSKAGQSVLIVALGLSLLFAAGTTALQLAGMAFRGYQLQDAADAGAQSMAHGLRIGNSTAPSCWTASDGLEYPAHYADAQVCRAVVAHLGALDFRNASVQVTAAGSDLESQPTSFRAVVTYRENVTSPLLQLFFGPTVTTQAEAIAGAY